MQITLTMPLDSVSTVLGALGTQPFDRVAPLIDQIKQQANVQIQAAQSAPKAEPDESSA